MLSCLLCNFIETSQKVFTAIHNIISGFHTTDNIIYDNVMKIPQNRNIYGNNFAFLMPPLTMKINKIFCKYFWAN